MLLFNNPEPAKSTFPDASVSAYQDTNWNTYGKLYLSDFRTTRMGRHYFFNAMEVMQLSKYKAQLGQLQPSQQHQLRVVLLLMVGTKMNY